MRCNKSYLSAVTATRGARTTQSSCPKIYGLVAWLAVLHSSPVKAFCVQGDPTCTAGFASSKSMIREPWMKESMGDEAITGSKLGTYRNAHPAADPSQPISIGPGVINSVGSVDSSIPAQDSARKIMTWHEKDVFKSQNYDGTLCANDPTGLNTINPC